MEFTVKAIQQCDCGAEIVVLRFKGPRTSCRACIKRAAQARFKTTHPHRKRELNKKWSDQNPDKNRAIKAAWQKRNPHVDAAKTKKYLAKKAKAYVLWANDFFIKEAYHLAQLRTKITGFEWQVDHIIPLQGKPVCGLHVENNLQVIPAIENRRKSNKLLEGNP